MWTEAGRVWLAEAIAAESARITVIVADGQGAEASRPAEEVEVEGTSVTIETSFGEDEANFEWRERRVLIDTTVLDEDLTDQGRKVQGSVWEVAVTLDFVE